MNLISTRKSRLFCVGALVVLASFGIACDSPPGPKVVFHNDTDENILLFIDRLPSMNMIVDDQLASVFTGYSSEVDWFDAGQTKVKILSNVFPKSSDEICIVTAVRSGTADVVAQFLVDVQSLRTPGASVVISGDQ